MYFEYGDKEIDFLMKRDKKLGEVIQSIGHINREVETDLFSSVIHHILGQQISTTAQATIWMRLKERIDVVNAENLLFLGREGIQEVGTTFRKADYIMDFAQSVEQGKFDINILYTLTDDEVIQRLCSLKGIGVWTAEMILLFCLQRPNVFSFGDLGILRGIRMVYHHKNIDRKMFEKYRKRFTPYCSVASFYFWAVSGGAIPTMKDYAVKRKNAV